MIQPSLSEQRKAQYQFISYCIKTLRGEALQIHREMKKQKERESFFSELSNSQLNKIYSTDTYFEQERFFSVLGNDVYVKDELIAAAIRILENPKRDIILLSYFLNMSDPEISKALKIPRKTIFNRRNMALNKIKNFLEGYLDD